MPGIKSRPKPNANVNERASNERRIPQKDPRQTIIGLILLLSNHPIFIANNTRIEIQTLNGK